VGEILKEKNVGENAGGVQVDEKELTVAKVANGETEQFDEYNNQNAQWIHTKNAANDAFEGNQQNQTGVKMQIRNCKPSRAKPEPYGAGRLKGSGQRGGERQIY